MKAHTLSIPILLSFHLFLLPSQSHAFLHASSPTPPPHFNLSAPRTALASAFLPPAIFFAGGRTSDGKASRIVDIFNTRLRTHQNGSFLSVARSGMAAAAIAFANGTGGGTALVMFAGGRSDGGASDAVDIYNVRTGLWSRDKLSEPRADLAAASLPLQHLLIFAGGDSGSTFSSLKRTVDIYDAVLRRFTSAVLSAPRSNLAAAALPNLGLAYFAGGYSGLYTCSDVVDVFNGTSRSFMPVLHLSQAREKLVAVAAPHAQVVVFAGGDSPPSLLRSKAFYRTVESYNQVTGVWTLLPPLSSPRAQLAAAFVASRSAIVFGGGIGPGNLPSAAVDMYNAFTGSKLPAPPLRIPRYDLAAAAADSGVWFAGGSTGASASQVTDDIEMVNPPVPLGNFSMSWFSDNACVSLTNSSSLPHNPFLGDLNTCLPFVKFASSFQSYIKVTTCGAVAEFDVFSDPSCHNIILNNTRIPSSACFGTSFFVSESNSFRFDCGYTPPRPPPGQRVVTELFFYSDTQCGTLVTNTSVYATNPLVTSSDTCTPFNYDGLNVAHLTAVSCAADAIMNVYAPSDTSCKVSAGLLVQKNNSCVGSNPPPGSAAYKLVCTLQAQSPPPSTTTPSSSPPPTSSAPPPPPPPSTHPPVPLGNFSISWFSDNACVSLTNSSSLPHNPFLGDVNTCLPFIRIQMRHGGWFQSYIKVTTCGAVAEFDVFSDSSCHNTFQTNKTRIPSRACYEGSLFVSGSNSFRFDCGDTPPPPPPPPPSTYPPPPFSPLGCPSCPQMNAAPPPVFYLLWSTSQGSVITVSHTAWAPALVTRLYNLVINKFYVGSKFYRVLPGFVNQWGVNADPVIGEIYNWRRNFPGSIVQPQPGDTPLQPGQTNVAGAISFSTSYLMRDGLPGVSWNATAELFVNLVNNSRLDSNHFVPVAMVTSGLDALAKCYSYGRMADECSPPDANKCPGPDEVTLYAKGNAYLNAAYPRMDYILSVDLYNPNSTAPAAQADSAHADGMSATTKTFIVIALIWAINFCCIAAAARACSLSLIHFVMSAALLGPLAWFVFCLKLRELAPGRVSMLPSPFRQLGYCVRNKTNKGHSVFDDDRESTARDNDSF